MNNKILKITTTAIFIIIFVVFYKALQETNVYMPKKKSNNVLLLEFNKFGVLKNKKLFNKDDINKIAFSEKITENDLSKRSFVEKLFSSLRSKMYGKK